MLLNGKQSAGFPSAFRLPVETIGSLDAESCARVIAASSDVAMVIDRHGIIRDIAISAADMPAASFADFVERPWIDTVTSDSRLKVAEMLNDARGQGAFRWREVNQQLPQGSIPLRYVAVEAGQDGKVIALGRDLRAAAQLQQKLLQAQQTMERDYARLRQAETRYRVLFQIASEAVLIVDPGTKKIVEANPAAGSLLAMDYRSLAGKPFAKLFHPESRDAAQALLAVSTSATQTEPLALRLHDGRAGFNATASLFRQDRTAHALVSLAAAKAEPGAATPDSKSKLLRVLDRMPDSFVVADSALDIVDVNVAFIELAQLGSKDAVRGQPLDRFIGRPGVDLRVFVDNLRDHGWVRNFQTVARTAFGYQEDVEVSAVLIQEGLEATYGLVIRRLRAEAPAPSLPSRELPRTAEQLMQLVGRVSLREIVAETTEVIERMCIEAALNLTSNNRASAAEMLGLSRQSLYSKMNRKGPGTTNADRSDEH
jgi:transcriptional regulator PpsR